MGMLADTLAAPSAYRVKKERPELWGDLIDRINGALLDSDLCDLEAWIEFRPLDLPGGWAELLTEAIEKKREELRAEDIGYILKDRYDFL